MPEAPYLRLILDGHPAPLDGHGTLNVYDHRDPYDDQWPGGGADFARVEPRREASGYVTVLRGVAVRSDPLGRPWTPEEVVARSSEHSALAVMPGPRAWPETAGTLEGHPTEDQKITARVVVTRSELIEEPVLAGRTTLVGVLTLERISFDVVAAEEMVLEMVMPGAAEDERP